MQLTPSGVATTASAIVGQIAPLASVIESSVGVKPGTATQINAGVEALQGALTAFASSDSASAQAGLLPRISTDLSAFLGLLGSLPLPPQFKLAVVGASAVLPGLIGLLGVFVHSAPVPA